MGSAFFRRGDGEKKVHYKSLKYSAAKLHKEGIVLEIASLSTNQFKNVEFKFKETADPGVLEVQLKFMGMEVKKIEIVFQDLLQLQYDCVAVKELSNDVKINVPVLVSLLNKKFYGQGK